jgi:hypothetical protein
MMIAPRRRRRRLPLCGDVAVPGEGVVSPGCGLPLLANNDLLTFGQLLAELDPSFRDFPLHEQHHHVLPFLFDGSLACPGYSPVTRFLPGADDPIDPDSYLAQTAELVRAAVDLMQRAPARV